MAQMHDVLQSGDWKAEKHVPAISAPEFVAKGEPVVVTVTVGKEIAHPNKAEHHIAWIAVYFLPEGEKFPYQIGKTTFDAHGASTQGPDTSTVYTAPEAVVRFSTLKSGTILAASYCNIHGLWESAKSVAIK